MCQISKIKIKHKNDEESWITRTLKSSIRKKNKLYHYFILKQTPESEFIYKKYENKLTSILRLVEKKILC